MTLQRHHFVKGYLVESHSNDSYMRIEESYDGQSIEIFVGIINDGPNCTCDCGCTLETQFGVDLSREQVKELQFCLKQLHFIDKE